MTKIFVTGATGYVGGDSLYTLVKEHPDYEITALVRNKEKGHVITSRYPSIGLVYGTLDDVELLAEQASKADVTCHWASCEHEASAKALVESLSRKSKDSPGFLIHLSGADNIGFADMNAGTYGVKRDRVFDDLSALEEIVSPANSAPHREVDLAVLEGGKKGLNTAIVCPPTIYGPGRGPGNQRSIQVPELALHSLRRGAVFTVGAGENVWNSIHVHDLSKLFLKLVEAAAQGGGQAEWGSSGFYFVENGDYSLKAIAERIVLEAKALGLPISDKVDILSAEESDKVWEFSSWLLGTNSRCRANRARNVLGWRPEQETTVFTDVTAVVKAEAKSLGLTPHL
ncbi:unnamed protein product [Clonostachys chloroleuca]|uniref:NAD(P)-binding domain-containing protein n=1 Tax=Clonostachys chloroleuca TaxID=1926264 RepID=A0AA35LR10_9HYPO|nr:unnamed protein product [Clonostachys chloroleuca]